MIDYGDRARIGFLIPSGNRVVEAELRALLPSGVAPVFTRLPLRGSSEEELLAMLGRLEEAARLIADAGPDLICFHCTAVSTFAPAMAADITARIAAATGLPAAATADAILAALEAFGARRLVLATPYLAAVHAREVAFLESHGRQVLGGAMLGLATNAEMAALPPDRLAQLARDALGASAPGAEALFLSCTAVRSAPLIAALEQSLGLPVITSNQAMAWYALRRCGIAGGAAGFGRLMGLP
ncbi:MAG: aspartate/glutamate racemase family protein [Rhodovarius sp.]|nr:aspartate/glutamate racemase family protein [Rhodovarius sp.]MDW8314366.1 aspartate/glutamate racemase family protein [Rhodovarius sp.]